MIYVKPFWSRWLLVTLCLTLLWGCASKQVTGVPLPQRDLVFQTGVSDGGDTKPLGFINSDGSGLTYLELEGTSPVLRPTWTSDGNLVLFRYLPRYCLGAITAEGTLRTWRDIPVLSRAAPVAGEHAAIVEALGSSGEHFRSYVREVDLDTGEITRTYVAVVDVGLSIGANVLCGTNLVYSRWWLDEDGKTVLSELVLLDAETEVEDVLARVEGDYTNASISSPACSPDGQWIAYTVGDGIYLLRPDGSERHRVVEERVTKWLDCPPAASWSPDSKWIAYHRCMNIDPDRCMNRAEYNSIFKLNIETLEEVLLVEGGLYPYWRLVPAEGSRP